MTKYKKLKHCVGCRDNFYNSDNSDTGECWQLSSARIIFKKEVRVDQRPPWDQKAKRLLDCFRKPGHVYVNPDQTC